MAVFKKKRVITPYDNYAKSISGFVNWTPFPGSGTSQEIQTLVQSIGRNDPITWFAFATDAVKMAWQALPDDLRRELFGVINDLIDDAIAQVADLTADVGDAIGDAADAIPIIGAIIKFAIQLVYVFVDWARIKRDANSLAGVTHLQQQQFNTIKLIDDPRDWVMTRTRVRNYLKWMGRRPRDGDWALKPSLRNSWGVDRVFWSSWGKADTGWCGAGVSMRCPEFWDGSKEYMGCSPYKSGNESNYCKRDTAISALFYPYWSPAHPAGPIALVKNSPDPNALLMSRQLALLSNPDANLRVSGRLLRDKTDRFVNYFITLIKSFKVDGVSGFLKVDKDGDIIRTDREDRHLIDEKEDINYSPSKGNMVRFYFRPDGIIEPYQGASGNNPGRWGVPAWHGGDSELGITIDQYNTVVGMTNAFFAARANMLRNGPLMKGLKTDHKVSSYDEEVRSAMSYAASYGKMLPVYRGGVTGVPTYAPDVILTQKPATLDPDAGGGAGALLGLGAAAAVAFFFMKR